MRRLLILLLASACADDPEGPIDPVSSRYTDRICAPDAEGRYVLRRAPKDLDQPGFDAPASQDILVLVRLPCSQDPAVRRYFDACPPEAADGVKYRFDECDGKAEDELGRGCVPYHDPEYGWSYDARARALVFASALPAGSCVEASYFLDARP